jgi:hypothetical protein
MIMRAEESAIPLEEVELAAAKLSAACQQIDCGEITNILKQYVAGFDGHEPWYDFVWVKQGRVGKSSRPQAAPENVASFPPQDRFKRNP